VYSRRSRRHKGLVVLSRLDSNLRAACRPVLASHSRACNPRTASVAQSSPVLDLEMPLLVPGVFLQAPWQATCRPSRLGAEAKLLQSRQKSSKSSSVKHQLSLMLLLPIAQAVAALLTGTLRQTEVLPFPCLDANQWQGCLRRGMS